MKYPDITTGAELKTAMDKLNLKQIQLAVASKIDAGNLSKFLKHEKPLSAQELEKLQGVIRACFFFEQFTLNLDGNEFHIPIDWGRLFLTDGWRVSMLVTAHKSALLATQPENKSQAVGN